MIRPNLIDAFRNADNADAICKFQLECRLLFQRVGERELPLQVLGLLLV
jgi:hypothetical protein